MQFKQLRPGQKGRYFTYDIFICPFPCRKIFVMWFELCRNVFLGSDWRGIITGWSDDMISSGNNSLLQLNQCWPGSMSPHDATGPQWVNSLAPGKFEWNFRYLIFQIISVIDGWSISCELALKWMWLNFTDDKSTLVQVMAWCRLATSHYLSQCWPKSLSPYGVTRPQWVNAHVS